jgi:hypothetical protein
VKKKFWPQPTTPLRGDVHEITFDLYHDAQRGTAPPAVQKLFDRFGAYKIKPKRNSRGVIWNGRAFWWSFKGYYRPGNVDDQNRHPLQHYIWEHHHRRRIPRLHEIWFKDRDHHNFAISNLELLHKSEVHKRCIELGEVRQISPERRMQIAGKRWLKHSRLCTEILLKNFNAPPRKLKGANNGTLKFLGQRRQVIANGAARAA